METIKRKIASLKADLDAKDEEIATLRAELGHEKIEREKSENEASGHLRKTQLLEESLDRAEENVSRLTAHVTKIETERDEAERRLRSLENAEQTVSEKYDDQEQELKRAKEITDETERKYEEILRKTAVLESDLQTAEEKADEYQSKYQRVEAENNTLITTIKSYEAADEHAAEKEANLEDQVAKLTLNTTEADRAMEQVTSENVALRKSIEELENLNDKLKMERDEAIQNLEETMREIGELA